VTLLSSATLLLVRLLWDFVTDGHFCRTIQISHAEDNADPKNGRSPALRCSDWLGFSVERMDVDLLSLWTHVQEIPFAATQTPRRVIFVASALVG
jgi:hypothetical protein